jgi:CRP-like cAMP-binding protein
LRPRETPPILDQTLKALLPALTEGAKDEDWTAVLAQLPLFSGLGERHLRRIVKLAEIVEFSPGDLITQYGEAGDAFYLILDGRARVMGKPRARVLRAGDFFGEMALLDGEPRSATVAAATELRAMKLLHRPFLKMLAEEPQVALAMIKELAGRVRKLERTAVT